MGDRTEASLLVNYSRNSPLDSFHYVVGNLAANMPQVVNICEGWIVVRS